MIFYHRKGQSFDGIKDKLRERLIKDPDTLEKKVGLPIGDVAFVTEHKSEKYDTNIEWGPMTFTEVMNKAFGDKRAAYKETFKDDYSGLFLSMDVFQTNGLNMDAEQLIKRIHENANVIEKQMKSLVSYCLEQDEK